MAIDPQPLLEMVGEAFPGTDMSERRCILLALMDLYLLLEGMRYRLDGRHPDILRLLRALDAATDEGLPDNN